MRSTPHTTPIRFVYFDVGGTMLRVRGSVGRVYAEEARARGIEIVPGELDIRFRAAWAASLQRACSREHRCSDILLEREWRTIVADTFGASLPEREFEPVFDRVWRRFATAGAWEVAPGLEATLRSLRARGLRLGVLSNWDGRLPALLESVGLARMFDELVVSCDVGREKPHAALFEEAARRARVPDAAILHVGDSWEADIEPARRHGWGAVWVARPEDVSRHGRRVPALHTFDEASAASWDTWLRGTGGRTRS